MGASSRSYHDRFLVIDDDVWHFGHSFNKLGDGSVSAVTKLHRPEKVRVVIMEDFQRADTFEEYWRAALAAIIQGRNSRVADVGRYLHRFFSPLLRKMTSALRHKPKSERQS
jgi:pimeloyl-ACP methyl ester carboxylesterase